MLQNKIYSCVTASARHLLAKRWKKVSFIQSRLLSSSGPHQLTSICYIFWDYIRSGNIFYSIHLAFYLAYIPTFHLAFCLALDLTYILTFYLDSFWHSTWHSDVWCYILSESIQHYMWLLFWHSFWQLAFSLACAQAQACSNASAACDRVWCPQPRQAGRGVDEEKEEKKEEKELRLCKSRDPYLAGGEERNQSKKKWPRLKDFTATFLPQGSCPRDTVPKVPWPRKPNRLHWKPPWSRSGWQWRSSICWRCHCSLWDAGAGTGTTGGETATRSRSWGSWSDHVFITISSFCLNLFRFFPAGTRRFTQSWAALKVTTFEHLRLK